MFTYRNMPVLASDAAVREQEGVTVEIGPPQIAAARDESPDEGTFVGPHLYRFGRAVYLNWSFDWDVVDPTLPNKPNGRVSYDGGQSWEKQQALLPVGPKYQTGEREVTAWYRRGFEIPGRPGIYRVPTWRSPDLGRTWTGHTWTTVHYPGTKGLDIYNPPEEYKKRDHNYLRGGVKQSPPAYLEPFYREVSRLRPNVVGLVHPQAADSEGTLYSMANGLYLRDTSGITDWDRDYWKRVNWNRSAVLMQTSRDHGCTWTFGGVPVDGSDYEGKLDFLPHDGFSEPSLVIFPDDEMLCALRMGSNKPLYCIRSYDRGRTWTPPGLLSPDYIFPIRGIKPQLVLLKNGILALGTGRPDCTIHFSKDRGRTWFLSETLFSVTAPRWSDIYSGSHTNVSMIAVDDDTLLYTHDATRPDPDAPNEWLRKAGHGIIITRRITVQA